MTTTKNETLGGNGERKEDFKRQKLMEENDDDFEKKEALREEVVDVHSLMRPYYAHIFPSKQLFEWLSYEGVTSSKESQKDRQQFIQNREFCFTLKGEIFVRYNSYQDEKSLRKDLKTKVPGKSISDRCSRTTRRTDSRTVGRSNRWKESWCLIST